MGLYATKPPLLLLLLHASIALTATRVEKSGQWRFHDASPLNRGVWAVEEKEALKRTRRRDMTLLTYDERHDRDHALPPSPPSPLPPKSSDKAPHVLTPMLERYGKIIMGSSFAGDGP